MINHNIFLHPEVKALVEKYIQGKNGYQYSSSELFAKYIIENKAKKYTSFPIEEQIFAGLIGDSFDINFNGNTNLVENKKFNKKIQGSIIANVAPDLRSSRFTDIFLSKDGNFNVPDLFKDFYKSEEGIKLTKEYELNSAYKQHFKIWAENNIAAAKVNGATKIVIPGMGLGIYAGPFKKNPETLQQLGDIQFEILQEIAKENLDIQIVFCGLGDTSPNIGQNSNIEGRWFNDTKPMVDENDEKVMRVVAGSLNIQLGGGSGDNGKIGQDTNILELQKQSKLVTIYSGEKNTEMNVTFYLNEFMKKINKLDLDKTLEIDSNRYGSVKSAIRKLKEWNFERFDNKELKDLVETQKSLISFLEEYQRNLPAGFVERVKEYFKDMLSLISRSLNMNSESNWAKLVIANKPADQRVIN